MEGAEPPPFRRRKGEGAGSTSLSHERWHRRGGYVGGEGGGGKKGVTRRVGVEWGAKGRGVGRKTTGRGRGRERGDRRKSVARVNVKSTASTWGNRLCGSARLSLSFVPTFFFLFYISLSTSLSESSWRPYLRPSRRNQHTKRLNKTGEKETICNPSN